MNQIVNMLWSEAYRPKTVQECILPKRIKDTFQGYVDNKNIQNLLLSGGPGLGKTTIAKAMCDEIDCDYIIINGSNENGIDTLRVKIANYASSMSMYNTNLRKMIIIDEADRMTPALQDGLKSFIEEFSKNCGFIFTCNRPAKIIEPIHSRCAVVDFRLKNAEKPKLASDFFKRVETILTEEKVEFDKQVVAAVVQKYFPDFRATLNALQKYATQGKGKIDTGILSQIVDAKIDDLIHILKKKDFVELRKWVALNSDQDQTALFRQLYDALSQYFAPGSQPLAVLILSEYSYKSAFTVDPEINLTACFCQMMADVEFV